MRRYLKVMGAAFLIGLTGAITPGPMLIAVVTLTAERGFWQTPQVIAGHALVEMAIVVAYWLGLAEVVRRGGRTFFLVMKVVGGVALVVLGGMMVYGAHQMSLAGGELKVRFHPVLIGAWVSISNPYFVIWWATVGLGLASQSIRVGRAGPPLFFVGHIHADIIWYLLVGAAVALGRGLMTQAVYRWIVFGGGLFLIAFGLYFALLARWHDPKAAREPRGTETG